MLTPVGYRRRVIDEKIAHYLHIFGAVCIEGPKWCGKTWACENQAVSASYIGDPAGNFMNKRLAELDPSLVLDGDSPRLIDEWQTVPSIWDAVRHAVDSRGAKGQFLLTGSSTPVSKGVLHSGTGRIAKLSMRTMSLFESGHSSGVAKLIDMFDDKPLMTSVLPVSLDDLIGYVLRGGWPGVQDLSLNEAIKVSREYIGNVPVDMERLDGKRRDSRKVSALLRALGRAESNMTSKRSLMKDVEEYSEDLDSGVSFDAVSEYLDCFSRLFIIEDQPSFENKLRSSVKALKSPKRHFSDPSLAAAAIGATAETLKSDLNTFGYLFESLCIHDLRVYADFHDGSVYHYHDEKDNEADAVVELPDGRWGLFEVKVGFNQVDGAATNLLNLKRQFETETKSSPAFLCVVCGLCNAAFKRPDGVYVVPLTALAP